MYPEFGWEEVKILDIPQSLMMRAMLKDGTLYYLVILATSVTNAIVMRVLPPTICNFLLAAQVGFHSILCNRLLLRIRGLYDSLTHTVPSITTILWPTSLEIATISEPVRSDVEICGSPF
ncbi:hypothetical protein DFH11DRAFT_817476 [Phellopilus nigrolimitatus]|nr:hypothetical protein DFH11DRAFT_817476 [Phellopilus nigrolimitatus]